MMMLQDFELWLAAGLVMMALETVVPGAFLIWLGLASLGTGALSFWLESGFGAQVASFAVLAAICVALGLRLRSRHGGSTINTPQSGLVGREAMVLSFAGNQGRVRLGDSDWPARLAAGQHAPEAGAMLKVVAVDGVTLVLGHR